MKSFDRLARIYRVLEYVAFGKTLEATRFRYLDRLRDCRELIVIGEGDGRFLSRLLKIAPQARVRCIDISREMLRRAEARLTASERARVSFECADARFATFPPGSCDAVVTLFVLDCFTPDDVASLAGRLARSLRPDGLWLFADFVIPSSGWRRWHAQAWVGLLYAFFRWQTALAARAVPPSEEILRGLGMRVLEQTTFRLGMLRVVLYRKRADGGHQLMV